MEYWKNGIQFVVEIQLSIIPLIINQTAIIEH
jgi:hypothetical protein